MKKDVSPKTKNKITPKKYFSGLLISIFVMLILAWTSSNFSLTFFTNWKILLMIIAVSFAFSLILIPFDLSAWNEMKNNKALTKKKIIAAIVTFIVFVAMDFAFDYFGNNNFGWSSIIFDAILAIFIVI